MKTLLLRTVGPYAVALLIGFAAAWSYQSARWSADVAEIERDHAVAQSKAVEAAREEERRMQADVDAVSDEGSKEADENAILAESAVAESERLRLETAALRRRFAVDNSRLATQWATAAEAVRVLTGLLEDADREAELLTEAYETARSRGLVCERSYDAVAKGRN